MNAQNLRVLFVDDETSVLDALKRMLHPLRNMWSMTFVTSAQTALEAMEQEAFDVIVCDIKMPDMDGAELLELIRKRYPRTLRLVLSGQYSEAMAMRLVRSAHRFIAKPCTREELLTSITAAQEVSQLLDCEEVERVVAGLGSLPTAPRLYQALREELSSGHGTVNSVAGIIAQDPALTAKVLQMVNSAFFGLPRTICHPLEAISFLGMDRITAMVLQAEVARAARDSAVHALDLERLSQHNLAVAAISERIATAEHLSQADKVAVVVASLLHDIGKLALGSCHPERYHQAMSEAQRRNCDLRTTEREIFGVDHAIVGGYLLRIWGLPMAVVSAALLHHTIPEKFSVNPSGILFIADMLSHAVKRGHGGDSDQTLPESMRERYLAWLPLAEEALTHE